MEITYRDLIKKIHPDLNPQIKDPGEKIAKVMANKSDPSMLMTLAIRWGIIEEPKKKTSYNFKDFSQNWNNSSYWKFFDYTIRTRVPHGSKVRFKTKTGMKEGFYITRTRTEIFLTDLNGYFSIKNNFKNLHGKIEFNTKDSISLEQVLIWKKIILTNNENKSKKSFLNKYFKRKIDLHIDVFNLLNIPYNCECIEDFSNEYYVIYKKGRFKVLRTNKKCVIIDFYGIEKTIQLKSIYMSIIKEK